MASEPKHKRMWPSFELAVTVQDWANGFLIGALVIGVIATWLVVWMGNVKEEYLKRDIASANSEAAKANAEAAKANARAEEARLEQEKLKAKLAWRRLTNEQRDVLVAELKGRPIQVWLTYVGNDPEATVFREDINAALTAAGVQTKFFSGYEMAVGLSISNEKGPAREALVRAFRKAGLPLVEPKDKVGMRQNQQTQLEITVGTKPPPF